MSYKFLSEVVAKYSKEDKMDQYVCELEWELKAAIFRLKFLEKAPPPAGKPSLVRDRVAQIEAAANISRTEEIRKLKELIAELREKIAATARVCEPDGTVRTPEGNPMAYYDSMLDRKGLSRVEIQHGLVTKNGLNVTTSVSAREPAIFVMSAQGHFHISDAADHRFHSSFLSGKSVAFAGEIRIVQGKIVWLSNKSGHYRPSLCHFFQVLHQLVKCRVMIDDIAVTYWYYTEEYLKLGIAKGRKTDTGTVATLIRWFVRGDMDCDDMYHFQNLKHAYGDILKNAPILAAAGLEWRETGDNPGLYIKINDTRLNHRAARTLLNSLANWGRASKAPGSGKTLLVPDRVPHEMWQR